LEEQKIKVGPMSIKEYFLFITMQMFKNVNKNISIASYIIFGLLIVYIIFLIYTGTGYISLIFLLFFIVLTISYAIRYRIVYLRDAREKGEMTFTFNEKEIQIEQKNARSTVGWTYIKAIRNELNFIAIYLSRQQAYVIPKRSFTTKLEAEEFFKKAEQYWKEANAKEK